MLGLDDLSVGLGFTDSAFESWCFSGLLYDLAESIAKCCLFFSSEGNGFGQELFEGSRSLCSGQAGLEFGIEGLGKESGGLSGVVESDIGSTGAQCCADSCSSFSQVISSSLC